jgi:NAD(P)-dependent dehydrogenase (short-subunit alcohol dehydrogenase family)
MPSDMFALDRKIAVVTGGNAGIGLGIAKGLGLAGATIVVAVLHGRKTTFRSTPFSPAGYTLS